MPIPYSFPILYPVPIPGKLSDQFGAMVGNIDGIHQRLTDTGDSSPNIGQITRVQQHQDSQSTWGVTLLQQFDTHPHDALRSQVLSLRKFSSNLKSTTICCNSLTCTCRLRIWTCVHLRHRDALWNKVHLQLHLVCTFVEQVVFQLEEEHHRYIQRGAGRGANPIRYF